MSERSSEQPPWMVIDVDGEPFEWCVVQAEVSESDGRPPHMPRRSPPRRQVVLMMRRPSDDVHSFGVAHDADGVPDESVAREAIRSCKYSTPLARDWRPHERAHARQLAVYWSRLPLAAQRELVDTWLERCARRRGSGLEVEDRDDLHDVSAKTLCAARDIGLEEGDDEATAQEREVRAAFKRYIGDG